MKNLKVGTLSILVAGLLSFSANAKELTFGITGMECESCITKVKNALMKIDGVEKVDVDLTAGKAVLEVRDNINIPESVVKTAINASGFNYTGGQQGLVDMAMPQEVKDMKQKADEIKQKADDVKNKTEEVKQTSKSLWSLFGFGNNE